MDDLKTYIVVTEATYTIQATSLEDAFAQYGLGSVNFIEEKWKSITPSDE